MVCLSNSIMMLTLTNSRAILAMGRSDLYFKMQILKVATGSVIICGTALATRDIYYTAFATCVITLINSLFIDTSYANAVYGYSAAQQIRDLVPTVTIAAGSAAIAYVPSILIDSYVVLFAVQLIVYWGLYLGASWLLKTEGMCDFMGLVKQLISAKRKGQSQ